MAIDESKVIWTGKSTGVILEEYQGKMRLKQVTKYTSQGKEVVAYEWVHQEKWNQDTKKREMPEKANCTLGVYLGDHDQAIKALQGWLRELGASGGFQGQNKPAPPFEESDIPF